MKVKELIKKLKQTGLNNEVRILGNKEDYTKNIYLSFDDLGDVLIYEDAPQKTETNETESLRNQLIDLIKDADTNSGIMKEEEKKIKILRDFQNGKIKVLGNGCYSVPNDYFILGITPDLVNKVLKKLKGSIKNQNEKTI